MSNFDFEVFLTDDLELVVRPVDTGQLDPHRQEYTRSLDELFDGFTCWPGNLYQLDGAIDLLMRNLIRLKEYRNEVHGKDAA